MSNQWMLVAMAGALALNQFFPPPPSKFWGSIWAVITVLWLITAVTS